MTVEEQVQFLKDQGVWEDFLTEVGEGNYTTYVAPNNIVRLIIWDNARQGANFWYGLYRSMNRSEAIINIEILIKQWKKEYPEYFV